VEVGVRRSRGNDGDFVYKEQPNAKMSALFV
jgi:hypothetical protein